MKNHAINCTYYPFDVIINTNGQDKAILILPRNFSSLDCSRAGKYHKQCTFNKTSTI